MTTDRAPPPNAEQRAANALNVGMFMALGLVILGMALWTAIGAYQPFVAAWAALPYRTQIELRRFPEALFWIVVGAAWSWRGLQSLRRRWRARSAT